MTDTELVLKKTLAGYYEMIKDVSKLVLLGTDVGLQNIDSNVLLDLCIKHQKRLKKLADEYKSVRTT